MNKTVKRFLAAAVLCAGAMYAANKYIEKKVKELEEDEPIEKGYVYSFRHGNVFFTKKGKGSPVLLLHDISPEASHKDWDKTIHQFTEGHTVYALDLLGCGKSDKPFTIYSNYMYVELINSFIKDVIGEKTTVIAAVTTFSAALMACNMEKVDLKDHSFIEKLVFINPDSLYTLAENPDKIRDKATILFGIPLVGEFVYNMLYYRLDDKSFLSAHRRDNGGRFLLSSIIGRYTGINIVHALKKVSVPIVILGDENVAESYKIYNPEVEIVM